MKSRIILPILLLLLALTLSACAPTYSAKCYDHDKKADDTPLTYRLADTVRGWFEKVEPLDEISIDDKSYAVDFVECEIEYDYARHEYDTYKTKNGETIYLEDGELSGFTFEAGGLFDPIDGIAEMDEAEVRSAVESRIKGLFDLSEYNSFRISFDDYYQEYKLYWRVKRDIDCAIGLNMSLDAAGNIISCSRYDKCRDDITEADFWTPEQKDAAIKNAMGDLIGENFRKGTYEIKDSYLYTHNGKDCIWLYINAIDPNVFTACYIIEITKN